MFDIADEFLENFMVQAAAPSRHPQPTRLSSFIIKNILFLYKSIENQPQKCRAYGMDEILNRYMKHNENII